MRSLLWCLSAVFPVCGALAAVAGSGVNIKYETLLNLAAWGWGVIAFYSGFRFSEDMFKKWRAGRCRKTGGMDSREKFFEVLNAAYDIKDRLKLLEKDTGHNIDRIYNMRKEAGYYDGTNQNPDE
jgi:hypothetical protein